MVSYAKTTSICKYWAIFLLATKFVLFLSLSCWCFELREKRKNNHTQKAAWITGKMNATKIHYGERS